MSSQHHKTSQNMCSLSVTSLKSHTSKNLRDTETPSQQEDTARSPENIMSAESHIYKNPRSIKSSFGSPHLPPAAFTVIQSAHPQISSQQNERHQKEKRKKKKRRATERPLPYISVFRLRRRLFSSLLEVPSPC